MGRIDILVNNAGITRDALALRMKDEDWQAVLEVNLTAEFRLTRAVLRGMVRRRHGRIIGITSVVGVSGNAGQANYAAAKAAMIGMSKSIAAEIARRGITVNCVAPGLIVTAMTDKLTAQQRARLVEAIPAGRFGAPEEVAAAVVYLASAEAGLCHRPDLAHQWRYGHGMKRSNRSPEQPICSAGETCYVTAP